VPVDPEAAQSWRSAFGTRLKELRTARGYSQMTLAHKVGLHPTYISSVERGERNISLVNIHVLALGLEVQPHEMLQPSSG
jgi:transcriptional regulator with XRE-family HTH domain